MNWFVKTIQELMKKEKGTKACSENNLKVHYISVTSLISSDIKVEIILINNSKKNEIWQLILTRRQQVMDMPNSYI